MVPHARVGRVVPVKHFARESAVSAILTIFGIFPRSADWRVVPIDPLPPRGHPWSLSSAESNQRPLAEVLLRKERGESSEVRVCCMLLGVGIVLVITEQGLATFRLRVRLRLRAPLR